MLFGGLDGKWSSRVRHWASQVVWELGRSILFNFANFCAPPGSGPSAGSATATEVVISPYGPTHISLYATWMVIVRSRDLR